MNRITIGMLSAFQIYVSQFWTPVESLFEIRREYLSAKPALSSFKSFLELPKMSFDDDKVNSLKLVDYIGLDENKSELHHPITFEFKENSLNVISGDNGVGKTTLLEALLNLTDRYKGHVLINDKSLENLSGDMVYIPSSHHISKYGILRDKSKSSLGQKKLAQINLALKTDKSVYIFDEPTNYLDSGNKKIILDRIEGLLAPNKIIVVVSHDELIIQKEGISLLDIKKIAD